jgi:hypothetical protein
LEEASGPELEGDEEDYPDAGPIDEKLGQEYIDSTDAQELRDKGAFAFVDELDTEEQAAKLMVRP